MASRLCYVPAKPLLSQPNAPASLGLLPTARVGRVPGIALSLLDAVAEVKYEDAHGLEPLCPLPTDTSELEAIASEERVDEETYEDDDFELPPDLQPMPQDDGIPDHPDKEHRHWSVGPESFFDESVSDDSDMKNLPDFDPYQDPEQDGFRNEIIGHWARADREECSRGARPKFYERFDIVKEEPNKTSLTSEDYVTTPLSASSPLAPYLLLYQIPAQAPPSSTTLSSPTLTSASDTCPPKTDADFLNTYQRYAFLSSHSNYKRITAFKQDDRTWPRWLVLQEFTDWYHDIALKKKQGEYWWRKHGWEGVLVEGFRLREGET